MPSWVWIIAVVQFLLTIIVGLVGWNYRTMVGKVLEAIGDLKRDLKELRDEERENRERIIRLENGRMNGINVGERLAVLDGKIGEIERRLARHHDEIALVAERIEVVAEMCREKGS